MKRSIATLGVLGLALGVGQVFLFVSGALAETPASIPSLKYSVHYGGGYADGGMQGEYFSNSDLKGTPQFTRRDVRVDFDWGTLLPIGGSIAEPYNSFPHENFSVRWTGRIIPRFSENYILAADTDQGARVKVRLTGQTDWSTVIDSTTQGVAKSAALPLKSGEALDLMVEYWHKTGAAHCRLTWLSPTTTTELIDPVTQNGINASAWAAYTFADQTKGCKWGRVPNAPALVLDAQAYPMTDAALTVDHGIYAFDGLYLLQFKGKAKLDSFPTVKFQSGGTDFLGSPPVGTGYDAATNTTSLTFKLAEGCGSCAFHFCQTSRDGSDHVGTGITDIKIMRPIEPGSTTTHNIDEVIYRPIKKAYEPFTCLRWLDVNDAVSSKWDDRTLPGYMTFGNVRGDAIWNTRGTYEYLVMLANETGKDLCLPTPVNADNEFFTKLAQLLKYGSDGKNPNTAPQVKPVYPPLNPNLCVYIEVGDPVINSSGASQKLAADEIKANTSDSLIFNYNGKGNFLTWHALRVVRASEAFRAIFGDDAMGHRVRMLLEYQNANNTVWGSLGFLDNYFNNGDGDHVPIPHPVSYYIWGGGGTAYYGAGNSDGTQDEITISDPSFELPVVAEATEQQSPKEGKWTFDGNAGIYRTQSIAVTGQPIVLSEPPPISGAQAAFLKGGGSISQSVNFTKAGHFALAFHPFIAGDPSAPAYFDIFCDDQLASPVNQSDYRVSKQGVGLGIGGHNLHESYDSAVFEIKNPGPHTIRFTSRQPVGQDKAYIVLDDVSVVSADAIMESGFGVGKTAGSNPYAEHLTEEYSYPPIFGLAGVSYEAGWSLGGSDFCSYHSKPIQFWCKYMDPRARSINSTAQGIFTQAAGFMNMWGTNLYWPYNDPLHATNYSLVQSILDLDQQLPKISTNGIPLPGVLTAINAMQFGNVSASWKGDLPARGLWASWLVACSQAGNYQVQPEISGEGSYEIEGDGEVLSKGQITAGTPTSAFQIHITLGSHGIRIRNTGGTLTVTKIELSSIP